MESGLHPKHLPRTLKRLATVAFSFHDSLEGGLNLRLPGSSSSAQKKLSTADPHNKKEYEDQSEYAVDPADFFSKIHLSQVRTQSSTQRLTTIYFQINSVQVSSLPTSRGTVIAYHNTKSRRRFYHPRSQTSMTPYRSTRKSPTRYAICEPPSLLLPPIPPRPPSPQFDAVSNILARINRDLRRGRELPGVERDRHDDRLRLSAAECQAVLADAGGRAAAALRGFRDAVLRTQTWIEGFKDELDRCARARRT
jgi:hypothetical protein